MEFSYFMPVRLLFGANVIDQLGATAKSYGTHALIVTGRSSTKRSGLLDRSIALLEAAGVRATVFNKVEPNPLTTTVMEGAALAREQGCDLVIGMGGGSMMDAAKAVAFCAVNGGDVNDYISGGKQGTGCLPGSGRSGGGSRSSGAGCRRSRAAAGSQGNSRSSCTANGQERTTRDLFHDKISSIKNPGSRPALSFCVFLGNGLILPLCRPCRDHGRAKSA